MKSKSKKHANKCDKKLQELNKIAQEHFRLLNPTSGHRGGNYLRNVYVLNYEELGYTLESILNICIMVLDGYDPNSDKRNIREAHRQFADVLAFTKNLIPHEELGFLDKSRKLLLTNQESK